ncbi:hypothetical protein FisN_13Hu236 [Fistulifera solaris]|jgi:hypothetical protein|uniref:Uncharacterized protein n=1 Tax=Fistulifera solaris TaxID=1519565 RepID=A0A1Z5KN12_FISSO|nr:hypothetical protein FisN_13Hu236 [Fistulifera solaris]|eukprot:GAX27669.1 hypothetical protein FisN_13Hu236 [Fistulifera solaris]
MEIARLEKRVEELAKPIHRVRIDGVFFPQDLFDIQSGLFSQWEETFSYMKTRCELAENLTKAAYLGEIKAVGEKALIHFLEILRLDARGPQTFLDTAPFLLLHVHRDDDAFDFMRHWMKMHPINDDKITDTMPRYFESKEGDWMYPREKNCRYRDMFEDCPNVSDCEAHLSFLVALLIIKCRIVATYDATYRSIDIAFATSAGKRIQAVQCAVTDMLIDRRLFNIDSQRHQVEHLLNAIHRNNPTMLPAILNPAPLLTGYLPRNRVRGDPSEVVSILFDCGRCLLRVPGAQEMLEKRFGKSPSYDLGRRWGLNDFMSSFM